MGVSSAKAWLSNKASFSGIIIGAVAKTMNWAIKLDECHGDDTSVVLSHFMTFRILSFHNDSDMSVNLMFMTPLRHFH